MIYLYRKGGTDHTYTGRVDQIIYLYRKGGQAIYLIYYIFNHLYANIVDVCTFTMVTICVHFIMLTTLDESYKK